MVIIIIITVDLYSAYYKKEHAIKIKPKTITTKRRWIASLN